MEGARSPLRLPNRRRLARLLCLSSLAVCIWAYPMRPGVVIGQSMAPSFRGGQVFLMSPLRNPHALKRGDVVVLKVGRETYIKRVRALPGDSVWGVDWEDTDGRPDYLVSDAEELARLLRLAGRVPAMGHVVEVKVPPGRVFVVGDAITNSHDSRHFGPVPLEAVKGRVVLPSLFGPRTRGGPRYPRAASAKVKHPTPQACR